LEMALKVSQETIKLKLVKISSDRKTASRPAVFALKAKQKCLQLLQNLEWSARRQADARAIFARQSSQGPKQGLQALGGAKSGKHHPMTRALHLWECLVPPHPVQLRHNTKTHQVDWWNSTR